MLKNLLSWFQAPIFPEDANKTRSAFMLNVILNTFLLVLPILFVNSMVEGNLPSTRREITQFIIAFSWLIAMALRFLMIKGLVTTAGVVLVSICFIGTTMMVFNLGTVRTPAVSFYFLAIVMAGLAIGRKAITWVVAASSIALLALLTAEKNGWLVEPNLKVSLTQGVTFTAVFVILGILLSLSVKSIEDALARARQEITARKQSDEALQRINARLEVLHEIDRALISSNDLQNISRNALVRIRQLIPCQRASISLFDHERKETRFLTVDYDGTIEFPDTPITFEEFGQRIIDTLLENKPWFSDDVLLDPQVTELDKRLATERGIRAWLTLPLMAQGQLIGALNLGRETGSTFTPKDVSIVHEVSNLLAVALRQANLYAALENELVERKKLISQLEASNAELERFTYTVSHDLKSPLVTIKGFLGMLDRDIKDNRPDRIHSDINRISGAADRMEAMLTDLLELSRIGRIVNPPVEIDTVQLIRDALESVDAQLRSSNVTVNIVPELPPLYGDYIRLREVFENLIGNAAKYMGDQENPMIEIGVRNDAIEPIFFVRDNGMGIEPIHHSKIFNLFEKLNPSIEGTGIGLALVKRIIETHGGKVWVESEGLGKGSTFCFTMPDTNL